MLIYKSELTRAMTFLGEWPDSVFIGQSCKIDGTAMFSTLENVPMKKRIEYFVAENNQLGASIGMALNGSKVISIFPRWNFLACAFDMLYNSLEKIGLYSHNEFSPSLIIRTSIGSEKPLNPQIQHTQDLTGYFKTLFKNIEIIRLDEPEQIFPAYEKALNRKDGKSTILVEWGDYYNEK